MAGERRHPSTRADRVAVVTPVSLVFTGTKCDSWCLLPNSRFHLLLAVMRFQEVVPAARA